MRKNYQIVNNLKVSKELLSFVNNELLKDTNISPERFWSGFDKTVHELAPKNKKLIGASLKNHLSVRVISCWGSCAGHLNLFDHRSTIHPSDFFWF